jgi:sialic acid synthase SpsE
VTFFQNRHIPLAINHCVSIYPAEDRELELNQIDFLRNRYPSHTIGFSTHEFQDWTASMLIAYAKGARTFERHIDIEADNKAVTPYCSRPEQIDAWFKAYHKVREMCGAPGTQKRLPPQKEIAYLDSLVRGVYAKRDLPEGHILTDEDVYLAIPLQKGQVSCRELMRGEVLMTPIHQDEPITIDAIDSPYASIPSLRDLIYGRGLDDSIEIRQTSPEFREIPSLSKSA